MNLSATLQEEKRFAVRCYSKAELATLYNPDQCITVALQILNRWIRSNPHLKDELEAAGYNKFRRSFTPKEVGIVVRYLGEP